MFRTDNPVRDAENYYVSLERKEEFYEVELPVTVHVSVVARSKEDAVEKVKESVSIKTGIDIDLLDLDFQSATCSLNY